MRKLITSPSNRFSRNKGRVFRNVLADIQLNLDFSSKTNSKKKSKKKNLFDSKRVRFAKRSKFFDENDRYINNDSPERKIKKIVKVEQYKKQEIKRQSCDHLIRKNIAKNLKSNVFKIGNILL